MVKVSIVLPCFNEEKTIGICIEKAKKAIEKTGLVGEIIVVDNNSSDASAKIAKSKGARVVKESEKGYGAACLTGFEKAQGEIIVVADSDNTYNLEEAPKLIDALGGSNGFVIGSRFMGKMQEGAMTGLHKHIGNPFLTGIFNILFSTNLSDTHSGFRAIKKSTLQKLELKEKGFNLTLEMIAKAKKQNIGFEEIPINYYKRSAPSKLSSFRDGFRHVSFMIHEKVK